MARPSQTKPGKRPFPPSLMPLIWNLLAATPAVGVALLGASAVTLDRIGPPETAFYRTQSVKAQQEGNLDGQRLCLETLNRLEPDNSQWMLELAYVLEQLEKNEKAAVLWVALAPPDKPGYAPAQTEHARRILERLVRNPPPDQTSQLNVYRLVDLHIRQGLRARPGDPELSIMLADLLLAENKSQEAQAFLEAVPESGRTPQIKSRLAALIFPKDKFKAQEMLTAQGEKLINEGKKDPGNLRLQRAMADTQMVRGDLVGAVTTWSLLRENATTELRKNEGTSRLIQMHIERIDQLWNAPTRDYGAITALIKSGLDVEPRSRPILQRLVKLADFAASAPLPDDATAKEKLESSRKLARERLEAMLAKGVSPDIIHLLLAADYHVARRDQMARLHFDLAYRANPNDIGVANNLAWYLAHYSPRDFDRAIALVNSAIEKQSTNGSFIETRGQIYARMGQFREAITDLEQSLTILGQRRSIHNTLMECYEGLGEPDLAKKHKTLGMDAKK
ncbi:MAG: tetratricopeptide repeat protein [Planctomycetota bacterium]|nr:tetratricopeptide repeat protein [Planctomycetota bacterium]RLS37734.1 MAG: hypothetical protein DWH82_09940 [Planctomycetota bacterium]